MAVTKIRGNTQIIDGTIANAQISASAAIATSKLADGAEFLKRDGSVALTGNLNANSNKIINLADPTGANDAANKSYVDSVATGLDLKASVRAATTANITLSGAQTIDGVSVIAGDRVLVKNQSTGSQNGIYVAAAGAWSRSTDADGSPANEVSPGLFTFVEEGTTQADSGWVLITDAPITLGTTALSFTQFSGAGSTTATNVGASGVGVFKQLAGSVLEFRKLDSAASGKVTVALNGDKIDFDIGAGTLVNADINASAAIARSKLASGSANHVIINDGSGVLSSEAVLAVSRGGTNSGAALNNNRVMVSSGSAIVEAAAITANRALISDTNGLPTHSSVTATELGYLSGVTSAVQTQLDARVEESKFLLEVPSGTIDGSNAVFTLANTPLSGKLLLFLNGLLQDEGGSDDFTISGATITFNSAPLSGDKLAAHYIY